MVKTLDVAWRELEDAFEEGSLETVFYLDLESGVVVVVNEDLLGTGEDLPEEDDPYREMREVHEAVKEGSERYLPIPANDSHEAWRDMEAFTGTVADDRLADRLRQAIQGRGAFRYFRDTLSDHLEERERWYAFQRQRVHQRILDWLDAEGIQPTTVPDPPQVPEPQPTEPSEGERQLLQDLTLVCLYLSSWEEGEAPHSFRRAWKGHRFEILDALEEQGFLAQGRRGTKSLQLTEEGIDLAQELLRRLPDRLG